MPHKFELQRIADHFDSHPLPPGACALIDLPANVFLDTEEESNVISAAFFVLCVKFENLPAGERPTTRENLRRMQKDVAALLDELLAKTLPADTAEKGAGGKDGKK
ncbi:hypothetical protein IAR55_004027 [Kwoniella newhampshirensis]|uniref:Uncharacterized protein n=1 Tax=Kwoniella newhampshirensis TaxID=1651941 RepID=A0AAW0YMD2_9TREE